MCYFWHVNLKKQRKPGSGRKPVNPDLKRQQVAIYLETRVINSLGGQSRLKLAIHDFINNVYQSMSHDKTNHPNLRPTSDSYLP